MKTKFATVSIPLIFVLVVSVGASNGVRMPDVTGGLDLAIRIFGPLREAYLKIIVEPMARTQALRRLRVLSNRLESLALEKQKFTEELLNAKWPDDQSRLGNRAANLQEEVRRLRSALAEVFEPLPDDLKVRGGEVTRTLEGQFSGKWQNLQDIAVDLRLSNPSLDSFRHESKKMLDTIEQMRAEVDKLIEEIDRGGGNT
jgi:hypothetical protein